MDSSLRADLVHITRKDFIRCCCKNIKCSFKSCIKLWIKLPHEVLLCAWWGFAGSLQPAVLTGWICRAVFHLLLLSSSACPDRNQKSFHRQHFRSSSASVFLLSPDGRWGTLRPTDHWTVYYDLWHIFTSLQWFFSGLSCFTFNTFHILPLCDRQRWQKHTILWLYSAWNSHFLYCIILDYISTTSASFWCITHPNGFLNMRRCCIIFQYSRLHTHGDNLKHEENQTTNHLLMNWSS